MRFAPAAQAFSGAAAPPEVVDERSFLRATEDVIRERCAEGSGVILGRAAAVVLRDQARCAARAPRRAARAAAGPGDGARGRRPRERRAPHARDRSRPRGLRPPVLRRRRARRRALPPRHRLDRAGARRLRRARSRWRRRHAATGWADARAAAPALAGRVRRSLGSRSGAARRARPPPRPRSSTAAQAAARPAAPRPPALCGACALASPAACADPSANELSGLVRSPLAARPAVEPRRLRRRPGPLRAAGRRARGARPTVTGAQAVDWEDIAAGPGPEGRPLLYVGDIGDNALAAARRRRLPRRRAARRRRGHRPAARLRLRYPDGAHDAEALLVDPLRGDLVIVTKALGAGRAYARLGRAPGRLADDAAPRPGDRALARHRRRRQRRRADRRPARLRPARRLGPPRSRAADDDAAAGAVPVADVPGRRGPGRGDRARPPRHQLRSPSPRAHRRCCAATRSRR